MSDSEIERLCKAVVMRAYKTASEAASALDDINARWGIAPIQHEVDAVMSAIQHPDRAPHMSTAYLIDPAARTVTEVERGPLDSLAPVYALLGCQYVEGVRLLQAEGDYLYVDEEGTFKADNPVFICRLYPGQVLTGRALWIGGPRPYTPDADGNDPHDGEETPPRSTLAYARAHIVFFNPDGTFTQADEPQA